MNDKKFNSFKKVARSLGYNETDISIVSYHSVSMGTSLYIKNVAHIVYQLSLESIWIKNHRLFSHHVNFQGIVENVAEGEATWRYVDLEKM